MTVTVFMLIERMIQLPCENSIPGIVCILLEQKLLPVIVFYGEAIARAQTVCRMLKPHLLLSIESL